MTDVLDDPPPTVGKAAPPSQGRFEEIAAFGSNPGNLKMHLYVPDGAGTRPLVVVLHGCRQTIEGYDAASGWSRLARSQGFLLLYPAQQRDNNAQTCFSWFEPGDIRRGEGEVESIRQMVATAVERHGADPRRTFICGLSAGGAMAGAMLATYPELFAGGAIIAGLPFGTAANVHEAYESMSSGKVKDAKVWGDLVRAASPHTGPWPSVAIWHGAADKVVKPINAGEIVKQWTNVHAVGAVVPEEDNIGAITRRTWRAPSGRPCVTDYCVPNLGHGVPVADDDPPAPFFLPAGISSSWHIANDWALLAPLELGTSRPAELPAIPRSVPSSRARQSRRRRLLSFLGL